MFQVETGIVQNAGPCGADGFDLTGAGLLVVEFAGFLAQSGGAHAARRHQQMRVVIPFVVALAWRMNRRINGNAITRYQPA